jgi:asparagine synthase (glutamine-hydrolysing)
MCGINGFTWKDESLINEMNEAVIHRGPDDQGVYLDEVSLGAVRLSIIDLSSAGRQPMSNEDKTIWIVHNGEVYNYQEVREALEPHTFKSNTDTEVILHSYEEWGPSCVERFNGMWAFAIYDKKRNIFFLSRDRFGIKPLYYYWRNGKFIFSSEIKGILRHDIDRKPNDRIIYEYLAFNLVDHSRETFFEGVHRMLPGENVVYDLSRRTLESTIWYDVNLRKRKAGAVTADEVRNLFTDSVKYRLIADVPVGSCLSGGIDSSSVVCTMDKLRKKEKEKTKENHENMNVNKGISANETKKEVIRTFSLVFPGFAVDETRYIDEVVQVTDVESYRVTVDTRDLIADLHDLILTQEEPFSSLSIYGQYKVMELAHKNHMKVLLDGQGGDELFAGYLGYNRYYLAECLLHLQLKKFFQTLKKARGGRIRLLLRAGATLLMGWKVVRKLLAYIQLRKMKFLKEVSKSSYSGKGIDLTSVLLEDLTVYSIPQLLRYEDRNSMRWSIEARVPFLDYRLVELSTSLPSDFKIRDGVTKYIFRKSMEGVVPRTILERQDKIGFAVPEEWMRSPEFEELVKSLVESPLFRSRKYWKYEEVEKLLRSYLQGKDHTGVLWKIVNTELWLRTFIDGTKVENHG